MILTKLKNHLVVNGKTQRAVLAKQFALSEDGVDAMLELWLQRNKVSKELIGTQVWYRWNRDNELAVTLV